MNKESKIMLGLGIFNMGYGLINTLITDNNAYFLLFILGSAIVSYIVDQHNDKKIEEC